MAEEEVGLIPSVVVEGSLGPRVFSILLTSDRCIFFLRRSSKSGLGAVLGGAVGALLAEAMAKEETVGSERVDIDALAGHKKKHQLPVLFVAPPQGQEIRAGL